MLRAFVDFCQSRPLDVNPRELRPESSVYRIERLLGEGLTSSVYKAVRSDSLGHSHQTVALKVLKSRREVSCLKREFELLARIDSPYCVRVLGWENLEQGSALALEWIEGATLLELARFQSLDDETIAAIVEQIHQGLGALAEHGLHHGDLSPTNVLVDGKGVVRIVDFGAMNPTDDNIFVGTPGYVAPEVWEGGRCTLKSDLFGLGMIEHDLRAGFTEVPDQVERCRERAFAMATSEPGLLCLDPENRTRLSSLTTVELNEEQQRLAECVRRFLAHKNHLVSETAVMERQHSNPSKFLWCRRFASTAVAVGAPFLIASLLAVVPAKAQAPIIDRLALNATLVLASHQWLKIEINGTEAGYTPLTLAKLSPGFHRISWKGRRAKGEKRIFLRAAQRLILTEKELNSREPLR